MRAKRLAAAILAACAVSCKKPPALESSAIQAVEESFARCQRWEAETGGGADKDCPAAIGKALEAYRAYPSNPELSAVIVQLADSLGDKHGAAAITRDSAQIRRHCETARAYFKSVFEASKAPNPYFQSLCPKEAAQTY